MDKSQLQILATDLEKSLFFRLSEKSTLSFSNWARLKLREIVQKELGHDIFEIEAIKREKALRSKREDVI